MHSVTINSCYTIFLCYFTQLIAPSCVHVFMTASATNNLRTIELASSQ